MSIITSDWWWGIGELGSTSISQPVDPQNGDDNGNGNGDDSTTMFALTWNGETITWNGEALTYTDE